MSSSSHREHPIRKMQRALDSIQRAGSYDFDEEATVIARYVRPLLDALEGNHKAIQESRGHPITTCPDCRLLAKWRTNP